MDDFHAQFLNLVSVQVTVMNSPTHELLVILGLVKYSAAWDEESVPVSRAKKLFPHLKAQILSNSEDSASIPDNIRMSSHALQVMTAIADSRSGFVRLKLSCHGVVLQGKQRSLTQFAGNALNLRFVMTPRI